MSRRPTVSASWLIQAAAQIERDAEQSMKAWILLGQAERYPQEMAKARAMRHAATIRNIGVRREVLRNSGIEC